MGNFNARSKSWLPYDIISPEGTEIDSLATMHGLQQLLSEPTHLLSHSSSCIDLVFTDPQNLAVDTDLHSSLHPYCHHQIIYCKFNLMIECHSSYERSVWDYRRSDKLVAFNDNDLP